MKRLTGKVALVTGGGAGLGRGMADRFCAEGAAVAILEIKPDITRDFERLATAEGYDALGIAGDVTDPESVRDAVAHCTARWGRLDTLVNNAGVTGSRRVSSR